MTPHATVLFMSETENRRPLRAGELRRRVRAAEQLRLKARELAAADVLHKHQAAQHAAREKQRADTEAGEAVAAALRLFGDTDLVAELTELPAHELNRAAKTVTAARAAQIIDDLQTRAATASRPRRRPAERTDASPISSETVTTIHPAPTPDA